MTASTLVLTVALVRAAGAASESLAPDAAALPTLTLEQALQEADRRNLDLKVAQARLDQAHEISKKVWANYLPQITAGGSYTRNQYGASLSLPTGFWLRDLSDAPGFDPAAVNGPAFDPRKGLPSEPPDTRNPPGTPSKTIMFPSGVIDVTIQKQDQLGAQFQVSQALLVPSLFPAIEASYLAERSAELSVDNARIELLFGVVQAYYLSVGMKEALAVQQRLLENARAHERDAMVRVEAGAAPKIILIRAKIERTRAEQDVRRAQSSFDSARIMLSTLLDLPDSSFDVVHPPEPPMPQGTPGQLEEAAVEKRPDLAVIRENTLLAQKNYDGVWYSYLPSVFFKGTYQVANVKGFTGSSGAWAMSVNIGWTIWDGGLRESQVRENAAKAREADLSERAAIVRARDEVKRALLDLESAQANRVKAEEQAKLAQENMQLVTVNFTSGVATQLDVADATTQLRSAELAQVAETLNAQLSVVRLMKATGEFRP
jgi:multidrug efflux system outer membrane protein